MWKSDEAELEKTPPPLGDVVADGALAVIAGADTTAGALASFYFILSNHGCYERLQQEIDTVYPRAREDATDASFHEQLTYLDACL